MTTKNDPTEKDLRGYIKKTLWSASILSIALAIAVACTYFFGAALFEPLLGALFGVVCATANIFAIGYAFYIVAVRDGKKRVLLMPIVSFIAMCLLAYVFANVWSSVLFGFALGLTAPLLFGMVVVFLG